MTTLIRDRYRIVGPVGEGGMGTVRLADDLRLPGRQCAIKCLRVPQQADDSVVTTLHERFAREASILAKLDHAALPKVSDFFEDDNGVCLVMDFVPGNDLHAVLLDALSRGRELDEAHIVRWTEDVCAALTYLHGQTPPVVHRDVKPSNIKLTPDGQVRLVDFGLAQLVEGDVDAGLTVTRGGGSRPYQPLEQYRDDGVLDARADVYALGATVYHLLGGRSPAPASERFVDPESLVPLADLRPSVAPALATAVHAALQLHPDDRPPTAEAFRQVLVTPVAKADTDGAVDAALADPGPADNLRQLNLRLAALVFVLILVALAVTFL